MEKTIVLHLKLKWGVRGIPLAYVVIQHINVVVHVSLGYDAYQNLMRRWLSEPPIINTTLNLKQSQNCLETPFISWQCDTFKLDNPLVHHILFKIFINMDTYVYEKQWKSMKDGQTVLFYIDE